ncbi:MAG: hypothetical protein WEE51_09570, partial [Pirellulaceae bacterium]
MLSSLSLPTRAWSMMTLIALSLVITGPLLAQDAEEGSTAAEVEAVEEAPAEEEAEDTPALLRDEVNALWTCLAAFLVFFMQAGFALVEAGFTRAKNACNIIMKNLLDLSVGSL